MSQATHYYPPITLRWVAGVGFGAGLIEWFSHARSSHVGALLPDGSELGARSSRIGAVPAGVQTRPPAYEEWKRTLTVKLLSSDVQRAAFWTFLKEQIGKPYDLAAIFGFASDRNWREPDAWFCSELQARALEVCGWFSFPLELARYKITPGDLLLAVSAKVKITQEEKANAEARQKAA
jgi:hypothetical protein